MQHPQCHHTLNAAAVFNLLFFSFYFLCCLQTFLSPFIETYGRCRSHLRAVVAEMFVGLFYALLVLKVSPLNCEYVQLMAIGADT